MRAIVITEPGRDGNMALVERDRPTPRGDEIVVTVAYCGCNWADTMLRRGTYPHPLPYPLVPGFEVSGRVEAVGEGVTGLSIGDRVAGFFDSGGGYAEAVAVPASVLIPLPEAVGLREGASTLLQGMTAWHVLHTLGRLEAGQSVLIHAIGGGVGLFATLIAKRAGARVIGTTGTRGKEEKALALGADRVVNTREEDFVAACAEFTDGAGIDLVLDSLGGQTLDRSFETVRKLGHVVNIGEAEGPPIENIRARCLTKSLTFTRFHLGHVTPGSALFRAAAEALVDGLETGWLVPPVAGVYPLERALDMHLALESRQVPGKLLLEVGGDAL